MSTLVLASLLVLITAAPANESGLSFEKAGSALRDYMGELADLERRWHKAAELIDMGNTADIEQLLRAPLPKTLDHMWTDRQNTLRKKAKVHGFYGQEWQRQQDCYALGRWLLDAGRPTLAAARMKGCTPPTSTYERQEFDRYYARALFESGRFAEAADRLAVLDTTGWSSKPLEKHAEWIATLRRYARNDPQAPCPPCEHFMLEATSSPPRGDLATILRIFRCIQRGDAEAMRTTLLGQFSKAGDTTARRLLLQLSATDPAAPPDMAAATLLNLGTDAYSASDFPTAIRWWQRVANDYQQTPSWPKALFNIATTFKSEEHYDEAIENFTRLRDAKVNDREPGAHLMEPYRNYRPRASWQIGLCRLASGDPEGALADFINTRDNFPFQSWCGNAHWEFAYKYAAYEGICHEMLGAYKRALAAYFRAFTEMSSGGVFIPRRIVDLYESVGQTDRLVKLCDEVDAYYLRELHRRHPELPVEVPETRLPTPGIRRILHIRGMSPTKQAGELIEMIDQKGGVGPDTPGALLANWQVVEAAKVLARNPDESFKLLRKRAMAKHSKQLGWMCYAMAVVDPAKAVPFVADELSKEANIHYCATLAFTLQQCGEAGIAALDRIEKRGANPHHKTVRATLALRRRWEPNPWPDLPGAPQGTLLPVRFSEIDEKVRIVESLPDSVAVDRSTPSNTIASWFMALRIADRDAYNVLTGDNRRLKAVFDDLCDTSGRNDARLLTYDLAKTTKTDNKHARAQLTLHLGKTDHKLTIELSLAEDGWRVESMDESGR